ncbi:uncharacterized protein TNCT_734451 [Trichonephila clavata]|uniref:Uncharacterized protein n=1 Tax=Trichonephila clavata TaxID=2740835 RepID=A0A8X6I0L2_TRICU|nr:uncharacterized protein TNCT_734451 [Trichonephila clavata]
MKNNEKKATKTGSDNNGEHLLTRTERSFGGNKIEPPSRPNSYWDDPHYRPYFDNSTERNATAQLGKTAYLNCKIRQLGDRTVGALQKEKLGTLKSFRHFCLESEIDLSWFPFSEASDYFLLIDLNSETSPI